MSAAINLADGIAYIGTIFEPFADAAPDAAVTIEMNGREAVRIASLLRSLTRMAIDMEIELRCHRDNETGREIGRTAETLATDHLEDLLPEVDGNVIRPDFGGRKP